MEAVEYGEISDVKQWGKELLSASDEPDKHLIHRDSPSSQYA